MNNIIRFRIGDWADDGHGKYDEHYIISNKTKYELEEAYAAHPDKLGFDLQDICEAYQDRSINEDTRSIIRSAGLDFDYDDKYDCISRKSYFDLEMNILKKMLPDFEYKPLDYETFGPSPGYGLFD